MIYVGNFSYIDDSDSKDNYCLMPCIVEAESADEAVAKFAEHFRDVRVGTDLLEGAHALWLDSLCEFSGAPEEPVICQWLKVTPNLDGLNSVTSALPLVDEDDERCYAYGWGAPSDDDEFFDPELDRDVYEDVPEEPFMRFDEGR